MRLFNNIAAVMLVLFLAACGGGGGGSSSTGVDTGGGGTTGGSGGVVNTNYNWPAHIVGYQITFTVEGDDPTAPTYIPVGSDVIYDYSAYGAVQGTNPVSGNVYYPDAYTYSAVGNIANIHMDYSGGTQYEEYQLTATSATTGTYYYSGDAGDGRGVLHNWGSYVISGINVTQSFHTVKADIKKARFQWAALDGVEHYELTFGPANAPDQVVIADNIQNTEYELEMSLLFDRMTNQNAPNGWYSSYASSNKFFLKGCRPDATCTNYTPILQIDVANSVTGYVKSEPSTANNNFGIGLAMNQAGDVIAASGKDGIYIFARDSVDATWSQRDVISVTGSTYGNISMDDSGNRLIAHVITGGSESIEVYDYNASVWTKQADLTPSMESYIPPLKDLSISGDATIVAAGYVSSGGYSGYVYTYKFDSVTNSWVEQAKILSDNYKNGDNFGVSVDIDQTGSTIVVGAPFEDTLINGTSWSTDTGAAYVFTRTGDVWTQIQMLKEDDYLATLNFATNVEISRDGAYILMSKYNHAWKAKSSKKNVNGVFSAPDIWYSQGSNQTTARNFCLAASDIIPGEDGQRTAVVGNEAEQNDVKGINVGYYLQRSGYENSGVVRAYASSATSSAMSMFKAINNTTSNVAPSFGYNCAISGDAKTLVISAPFEDGSSSGINGDSMKFGVSDSGAIYIY